MAKSLTNFIVGIGADTTKFKEGVTDVNSSLGGMRTMALRAGGALAGSLVAVGAHALSTAQDVDKLAGMMQYSDAGLQYFYNYGNAVARMGGDANTAHGELMSLQKALNAFQRQGDRATLEQLAIATGSGDTAARIINMTNDLQTAQSNLADVVVNADKKQKLRIQEVLGLDDATMRLLEKGSMGVNLEMNISQNNTGDIEQMVGMSRELVSEWETLKQSAIGFGNELAQNSIPAVTDLLRSTNEVGASIGEWYRHARDFVSVNVADGLESYNKFAAKSDQFIYDTLFSGTDKDIANDMTVTETDISNYQLQQGKVNSQGLTPTQSNASVPTIGNSPTLREAFDNAPTQSNVSVPTIGNSPTLREAFGTVPTAQNAQRVQPVQVNSELNVTLEVDGRKMAEKVIEVMETKNHTYLENTITTTGR